DVVEVPALDEAHGEEGAAVRVDAEIVDGDDAGVVELAGDVGLLDETRAAAGAAVEADLHGDVAVERLVADAQDAAHAAARDLADGSISGRTGPVGAAVRVSVGLERSGVRSRDSREPQVFACDVGLALGEAYEIVREGNGDPALAILAPQSDEVEQRRPD